MEKGRNGEEENMAAWLVGVNTLKVQPLKLPPLGPTDVRVRMKAVGICGTDVHYLKTMRMTRYVIKEPMVIGHESSGIIEEVGSEVKSLAVGDRVALDPGLSCGRCNHCKVGRHNLCEETKCLGLPPVHGALANQLVHPAELCFKLPDNVSLEEGAVCEPLSVAIHACRRANISPETNVLIIGVGAIGLLTMFTARAFGSQRIIVVDVDELRLSAAKSLGANDFVKVSPSMKDLDEEVELIQKAMGSNIDVTFDCAGFGKTMSTALNATRTGGKVCLVGMGHNEMTIPLTSAVAASHCLLMFGELQYFFASITRIQVSILLIFITLLSCWFSSCLFRCRPVLAARVVVPALAPPPVAVLPCSSPLWPLL